MAGFIGIKRLVITAGRKREIVTMRAFRISHRPVFTWCMLILIVCAAQKPGVGSEASYLSFQVPGALGTYPMSINNSMTVTGYYTTSPTTAAGFFRDTDGAITTFSVRGSLWTEPESINAAGDITGFYEVVSGYHRALRDTRMAASSLSTLRKGQPVRRLSRSASTISARLPGTTRFPFPFRLASFGRKLEVLL